MLLVALSLVFVAPVSLSSPFVLLPGTGNINSVNGLTLFLCICQCSDYLGLSLELGSFLAGVMISTTDFAHHTLEQVLFCILFGTSVP
jgi:Kef-type K+ transport system membrane component KefB